MNNELFRGQTVYLTDVDAENDSKIEAEWTSSALYAAARELVPFRPRTAAELQAGYQSQQKESAKNALQISFAIRRCSDDTLVGILRFPKIFWTNGSVRLTLSFGDPESEARYGEEVLRLAMRYAFSELNLHRLAASAPEFFHDRLALLERMGFQQEARRRQVVYHEGRLWDLLLYSLLENEWQGEEK
jgi:RimJ/RimL family protein N-acetyltransferase